MEAPADLSKEEVRLFSMRVERGLAARPLRLDPAAHHQLVAELVGRVGEATFYDLLSVGPGASGDEVHAAYDRLARRVHPSHAGALGLSGKEGVLELLFERATQAYLTLSHPDRRKRYDGELGAKLWSPGTSGGARSDEERQVARRYFVKANVLAASEEYHQAIDLLRTAARIDPRPEYYALLGQLEAKNPHWLRLAEDNLARAIELGGPNQGLEAALAHVREQKAAAAGAAAAPAPGKEGDGAPPSGLKRLFRR